MRILSIIRETQTQAAVSQLTRGLPPAIATLLLGPPELRPNPAKPQCTEPKPAQPQCTEPKPSDPFVDLMVANFNDAFTKMRSSLPMGMTENNSPTYLSSGNPCLDFFFHVVPDTPPSYLDQKLPLAWAHDSLTTLKLICNLRGVRGFGKSDKEGFYTAAFWLHQNHPKTLACNLASFAQFGCFRDLPEILYRVLQGQDVREKEKAEWLRIKGSGKRGRIRRTDGTRRDKSKSKAKRVKEESREVRINKSLERDKLEKEKASALRTEKMVAKAKKALDRYQSDSDYQFLHDQISDLFAECLKSDMECLKRNNYITLAAKWCPSIYSSFDRATLLCESIARKVFPRELYPEYEVIEDEHYAYRVRDRLKKEVLVPLRKAMDLPEVYMTTKQWGSIPYNKVASVAMKLYKEKFLEHDKERFSKYLEDVKAGKSKIAAGALLPHEIIAQLNIQLYDFGFEPDENGDVDDQVAELQWKRMVDDMLKQGNMNNCLAVCDVSGSMGGTPMEVSVALGLLVSELSEEPWKGKVITFSGNPQLHLIEGDDLRSKCEFVRRMDWGMNTDFQKVFDLLLQVAVNGNLKPEHMIKRIFVFSDMEFDHASSNSWETDYEAIQRKFKEKGYENAVPQIVFWNLRHSSSTPVSKTQPGVALLSGFSKNLMKMFFKHDGEICPELFMEIAISGEEYQSLTVVD
ncbi:uncharacterized protein LOC110754062 [Prunus avium]|uniref:Uncharacterized protein LOC110754062 n=1 Tax=Prunus avium TaxID=42229 RepID=A0A6P5SAE3_PRUAV|nr:uncharacterized protein LOC110754062 [Prunus avium]